MEMMILAEMKIKNRGTKYFPWGGGGGGGGRKSTSTLFSMKIQMIRDGSVNAN